MFLFGNGLWWERGLVANVMPPRAWVIA